MPLLVSSPCVDYREYPRLHVRLTADFQYHIRCDTAHLCQQPPVVEYQGPVLAGKCEHNMLPRAQSGTRLSRYCIHCAPAFTPQCGQERLLHRKQTFFVWQQSGDEQHHCVYPISVVPHAMIFVTDSMTTGRTEPSGCFSSQLSQRFPC